MKYIILLTIALTSSCLSIGNDNDGCICNDIINKRWYYPDTDPIISRRDLSYGCYYWEDLEFKDGGKIDIYRYISYGDGGKEENIKLSNVAEWRFIQNDSVSICAMSIFNFNFENLNLEPIENDVYCNKINSNWTANQILIRPKQDNQSERTLYIDHFSCGSFKERYGSYFEDHL